jgi:hypothetical protein
LLLVIGCCCGLLVGGYGARSAGAESVVQAIICRGGATLSISQPVSDSVVVNTTVSLAGEVTQANQIEITIDGQFDGVIPLNAAATSFTTTVQLTPGTHTIRLMAVDACQIANATDQVVVTYQAPPASSGSVGGETTTNVPGESGVVIGGKGLPVASSAQLSPFERLLQPFVNLGRQLDLVSDPTVAVDQQTTVPQLVRFSLVAAGLACIIFAAQIVQFANGFWLVVVRRRTLRRSLVLALGIGLLALGFLL